MNGAASSGKVGDAGDEIDGFCDDDEDGAVDLEDGGHEELIKETGNGISTQHSEKDKNEHQKKTIMLI